MCRGKKLQKKNAGNSKSKTGSESTLTKTQTQAQPKPKNKEPDVVRVDPNDPKLISAMKRYEKMKRFPNGYLQPTISDYESFARDVWENKDNKECEKRMMERREKKTEAAMAAGLEVGRNFEYTTAEIEAAAAKKAGKTETRDEKDEKVEKITETPDEKEKEAEPNQVDLTLKTEVKAVG